MSRPTKAANNNVDDLSEVNRFGDTKTEASRKPVPLHPSVAKTLAAWREESPYPADTDFVFPSLRLHGKKPVTPDMILKK